MGNAGISGVKVLRIYSRERMVFVCRMGVVFGVMELLGTCVVCG